MHLFYLGHKKNEGEQFMIGPNMYINKEYKFNVYKGRIDGNSVPTQVTKHDGDVLLEMNPHSFRIAAGQEIPEIPEEEKVFMCPVAGCGKEYKATAERFYIKHLKDHVDNDELDEMPEEYRDIED